MAFAQIQFDMGNVCIRRLLIPLVSFLNYVAQKRSIERQIAAMPGGEESVSDHSGKG